MADSTLRVSQSKNTFPHKRAQRFAYASHHGAKRIAQRTSMNILELMQLLDNDVCVNVGQVAGSHRRHLLFYSPKDKFYYVAIQNVLNGKIITVLPPAYHKNSAWKITDEQYQQAKRRYEDYTTALMIESVTTQKRSLVKKNGKNPDKPIKYRTITTTERIYTIWVQALYIDKDKAPKRKTLFKASVGYYIDDFQKSIDKLLQDPDIFQRIDSSIQKKRLFQGSVYAITFCHKKDLTLFRRITLRCESDAEYRMIAHNRQLQYMAAVLAYYLRGGLALPVPSSMRLLQLSWLKSQSNDESNQSENTQSVQQDKRDKER